MGGVEVTEYREGDIAIPVVARSIAEHLIGLEPRAAVLRAALSRLRPILMTTLTTVLGSMPLIISLDPVFFSMAIVLACGLVFGTVLTLGIVPVIYAVLFRSKARG